MIFMITAIERIREKRKVESADDDNQDVLLVLSFVIRDCRSDEDVLW